jgi:hypothetical protein
MRGAGTWAINFTLGPGSPTADSLPTAGADMTPRRPAVLRKTFRMQPYVHARHAHSGEGAAPPWHMSCAWAAGSR